MTEQLPSGNEDERNVTEDASQESIEALGRASRFVSGPGDAIFHISAETAEKIKEAHGGELPDHFRIKED